MPTPQRGGSYPSSSTLWGAPAGGVLWGHEVSLTMFVITGTMTSTAIEHSIKFICSGLSIYNLQSDYVRFSGQNKVLVAGIPLEFAV